MDTPFLVGAGLFGLTMVICLAFLHGEGMWGNALTLINMFLAVIISINAFEPAANQLEGLLGGPDYMDVLALWLVYIVAFLVLRLSTDAISRMKLRFSKNVEQVGTFVFAGLVGCLMYAFVSFTLHTAPIQPNIPTMKHFEIALYGLLKYESRGAFSSFLPEREFEIGDPPADTNLFGRYGARRLEISKRTS
jgi:hypothetical protein